MSIFKTIAFFILILFAGIGFIFTGVFIAMQFGWFNVRGSIETRNNSLLSALTIATSSTSPSINPTVAVAPDYSCIDEQAVCDWTQTREWNVVAGGLQKDLPILERVSTQTGVSPRLIAAVVVPEQVRFFTSNREVFKRYFEPLKILGSLSKFSLGVSGIKQDTANEIERNASDPNSAFYPGDTYASLLTYAPDVNQDDELFNRLTNDKDHYYSYLYTALFIKEILKQWSNAGYDISDKPEIVGTIFNIGFVNSKPNANPQVGGAIITVGGTNYAFGRLTGLFYQSTELPDVKK